MYRFSQPIFKALPIDPNGIDLVNFLKIDMNLWIFQKVNKIVIKVNLDHFQIIRSHF